MSSADDIDIDAIQIGPDPDKLLVYHRQQLSAMLDGELSPDQAKFMLRRLQHDGELAACWDRWQVCGDMLRGQHHALLPSDFAARVARGIAGEEAQGEAAVVAARPSPRRLRWGGGAALAASVALVAVFAPRMLPEGADTTPSRAPVLASSPPVAIDPANGVATAAEPLPGNRAPALPEPADVAPAVLATALAVAEAPRRAAERRARAQEQQSASGSRQSRSGLAGTPSLVAAATLPAIDMPSPQGGAFPAPAALQPRPWPRAILPGTGDSAFSVGYGQMPPVLQGGADAYEPFFRPRVAAPVVLPPAAEAEPAEREPAPGSDVATP